MKEKIRIGYIGLGRRGCGVLNTSVANMGDVEIVAICDILEKRIEKAKKLLAEKGRPEPYATYDYKEILKRDDIDAVFIMTPWNSRIKMAIDSMNAGKYTAIEVGCAFDISECYELVETYERTRVPVMMLENCCYGRFEMAALRMVKEGLFGEIVHCDGSYCHYLPTADFFVKVDGEVETGHYRLREYQERALENYPTHELGPICKCLNINKGNRLLTLTSFGSKARGLETFMKDHPEIVGENHPLANKPFKQPDILKTIITCADGTTIHLTLDTSLPLAYYSRDFTVRGTKGMCKESGSGKRTYFLEGMEEGKVFDNQLEMYEKYDHPLHEEFNRLGPAGGHGGIDWLVCRAFIESVKNGTNTPIDAYDTATLLAIGPLSEMSLAQGSQPVSIPDFTRGRWFRRENELHEGKYSLDKIVCDPDTPIFIKD